jgi:hypothetical protein
MRSRTGVNGVLPVIVVRAALVCAAPDETLSREK